MGEAVINEWSPEDRSANLRILIGPARRVYERAGFIEEGRLRAAFRFNGEPVDVIVIVIVIVMAMLRADPEGAPR